MQITLPEARAASVNAQTSSWSASPHVSIRDTVKPRSHTSPASQALFVSIVSPVSSSSPVEMKCDGVGHDLDPPLSSRYHTEHEMHCRTGRRNQDDRNCHRPRGGGIPSPHSTLSRKGVKTDVAKLTRIMGEIGAAVLVVGLPLELDDTEVGPLASHAKWGTRWLRPRVYRCTTKTSATRPLSRLSACTPQATTDISERRSSTKPPPRSSWKTTYRTPEAQTSRANRKPRSALRVFCGTSARAFAHALMDG